MAEIKLVPRSEVDPSITWDMTLLYPSDEAFYAELEKLKKEMKAFKEKYENQLGDLEVLDEAIRKYEAIELAVYRASHYAELPMTVDRLNPKVVENATAFEAVSVSYAENMSFVMTELISLDEAFLNQFIAEKRPDLAYFVEKVIRQKKHTLSKDAEQVLSNLSSLPSFYQLYEVTKHEDMQFESFEANGKTLENSFVLYENLHETMRGYDSVIDYLLDEQDGDRELYDRQIRMLMTDLAPHMQRYIKLLAKEHGISDMQFMDAKINLDPEFEVDMTIEESREYLKKALGILGEDYKAMIDESYDKRWTDFPQNIGKSTGGFCATVPNVAGFILLSWTGKMNEVFVLAHELGHAYHFMSTGKHQTMLNNDCPLYFVEAPSTCNEVIVSNYLLKTSTDARFKRWIISNMISRTYFHNMVTHYMEAVYQDRIYKMIDNNEMLNADVLSNVKKEVMQEFFGDSLVVNEGAELTWMRQPHYYMGLYPYTYSAGLTIGTAIANQIEENPEHAKVWLDTLSKGGSMSAKDLAIHAGCDVSTDEPLKQAIAYVGHLVDQLESLTAELKA